MLNELEALMKKRQKETGLIQEPTVKPQEKKNEPVQGGNNFMANKKMLEAFFNNQGGGGGQEKTVTQPKEEIKGNQEEFMNARKMLEMKLGEKKGGGGNSSSTGLPPPPSLNLPPPPPPPPTLDLEQLPTLPPPPGRISTLNLGRPPSLTNLPPPPRLSTIIPPPPPVTIGHTNEKIQNKTEFKKYENIPNQSSNSQQQGYGNRVYEKQEEKHQDYGKRSQPRVEHNFNQGSFVNNESKTQKTQVQYQQSNPTRNVITTPTNNLPPPPPPQLTSNLGYEQKSQGSYKVPSQIQPEYAKNSSRVQSPPNSYKNISNPYTENPHGYLNNPSKNEQINSFKSGVSPQLNINKQVEEVKQVNKYQVRSEVDNKNIVKVQERSGEKARQNIFNSSKPNLSAEFFGNDLAGFVKREFIRQTDVLKMINFRAKKEVDIFHFPSIENQTRDIQPIETLYADVSSLDLASCYLLKNLNSIKVHNDARQEFFTNLKNYDWKTDKMKLNLILEMGKCVPQGIKYREPNFVKIKNGLKKCGTLLNNLIKEQKFNECAEMKELIESTEKYVMLYTKKPEGNEQALEEIMKKLAIINNL